MSIKNIKKKNISRQGINIGSATVLFLLMSIRTINSVFIFFINIKVSSKSSPHHLRTINKADRIMCKN